MDLFLVSKVLDADFSIEEKEILKKFFETWMNKIEPEQINFEDCLFYGRLVRVSQETKLNPIHKEAVCLIKKKFKEFDEKHKDDEEKKTIHHQQVLNTLLPPE